MARRLRHEPLEERRLLSSVPYQDWLLQTTTGLHECGDNFTFDMVDWDGGGTHDLVAIKKWSTGTASTEVHVFSGESQFQTPILQTGTALGETDQNWEFAIGGFGDLVAFNKAHSSGYVQMLVLTRGSTYQSMWVPHGDGRTGLYVDGADWDLEFADWDGDGQDDLIGIKKDPTYSNKTQVKIYSGASEWRTCVLSKNTPLDETGAEWDFEIGTNVDIVGIKRYNTESGRTEVYALDRQTDYQTFIPGRSGIATRMGETAGNFEFEFLNFGGDAHDDLVAIMKSGTTSHTTELHMVSGGLSYYPGATVRAYTVYSNGVPYHQLPKHGSTQYDNRLYRFIWSAGDLDGNLASVSVVVKRDSQVVLDKTYNAGSSSSLSSYVEVYPWDAQRLGTYTAYVTATDTTGLSTTDTASFILADDDTTPPDVVLGGSEGTELVTQAQQFTWQIQDPSGIQSLHVKITRDTGDGNQVIYETTDPALTQGTIDFDATGPGRYEIRAVAADNDHDRPSTLTGYDWSGSTTFSRSVIVAPEGERIYWWNRGGTTDGFADMFGAGAAAARAVVDAALSSWERVITSFNFDTGPDVFALTVQALVNPSSPGSLGGMAQLKLVGDDGRPRQGAMGLFCNPAAPLTGGYFVDSTPEDSWEYDWQAWYSPDGPSFNAFAGIAPPGSPAYGRHDLFSTAAHEMLHLLGLSSGTGLSPELLLQSDPNGYLTPTAVNDHPWFASDDWPGKLWVFDGPSVTALLTSNNGGADGDDFGRPVHVALTQQTEPVEGVYGSLDILNASGFSSLRKLPSNLDALILQDAYGYNITLPETFGTMYSILNETTGELLLRGGFGWSDDQISIERVESQLVVGVDVGNDPPGTGPTDAFVSYFDTAEVHSIRVLGYEGDDTITIEGDLGIPVDVVGGYDFPSEHDTLSIAGTAAADSISADTDSVTVNGVTIQYAALDHVLVDGQEGGDVYVFDLGAAGPGTVTVADSGSAGVDTLTVNGTAMGDTLTVTEAQVTLGSPVAQTLDYSGVENVSVDGRAGDDTIAVDGGHAAVSGGDGIDLITIHACDALGVFADGQDGADDYVVDFGALGGVVTISDGGTLGDDHLTVNGTPGDDWIVMTPSQVTLGDPPVETIDYNGMEDVTVDEGAGNDTVIIDGSQTTILGGPGQDVFVVNANGSHGLLLDGQDGSDTYTVNLGNLDGAVTIADTGADADTDQVTVNGTAGDDAITLAEGQLTSGDQTVFFTTVEDLSIDGGGGNDTVDVEGSLTTPALWENSTGAGITAGVLLVVGTEGNDNVAVDRDRDGTLIVCADFIPDPDQDNFKRFDASEISQIRVIVVGGDDHVTVAGSITISALVDGGPGADCLKGGAGHDVLLGGVGDDLLLGKSGRDLLIGGQGADRIVGNGDDDILIGGYTAHDATPAALDAIMDEWTRPDTEATYQERIDHLGGAPGGWNGSVLLDRSTVSRDGAVDILTGSAGLDWIWFDEAEDHDRATDLKDEAFVDDLGWIEA